MSQPTHASPPEPPAARERLTTIQAFSRFAIRVMLCAERWRARWGVPEADGDDVLQETLLQTYRHREAYDPERGRDVDWAYRFFGQVVRNYRRVRARRLRRVDVAAVDLPDVAAEGLSPEEEADEAMKRRLLDKCLASLDRDSAEIVLARAEGIDMQDIAAAHGVSVRTAYAHHQAARETLQEALRREQAGKRAHGAAVLPISLDQLLASKGETSHVSDVTARRMWKALDRVMGPDKAAGRLGDDGTEVQRYMGVSGTAPRVGPLARALRSIFDPRVSHALIAVISAAGGALVTYQIMKGPTERPHDSTAEARTREAAAATVSLLLGPAPSEAPASERSMPAREAPELRPDAGAPEPHASARMPALRVDAGAPELRPDAGPAVSAAAREDIAAEQALFERGSTLYQEFKYGEAIEAFQEHASEYPRGRFASRRDRLWTLALIRAGRTAEAHERIERLRRAKPDSPLLKEFDEAMNPHTR